MYQLKKIDYILVFSNPDHHEYEYRDNIMSFGDVSKDFDKVL